MRESIVFGSRALNLSAERRKALAEAMRTVRAWRALEQRKALAERDYLATLLDIARRATENV